ncbi:[Fe-Fe] hydrogenase large subunit C-terminal domain-containing protein [Breznakiella homolactica]|uniref:4Fe-4S binding protein n=1 Tax=Breznakiella homolactica TaxID=2798577 RepID=A0A7T7XNN4_9SPIR|nr:[Fe-Fe] hydrogenase large subunit C-terminal domain-containing protein [Breznakiella homolactica]QQO09690.1 4Fe-4S binding protein [Breznakiella homolactica]
MDLLNPVYTEKAECQDCYKCLRECTVKAIKVEGGRAAVVPELCVLCGHCVEVCPVGAKRVRNDLPRAKLLLESGRRVIASVAPAFASEFSGIAPGKLAGALKKLGFWGVSETARGADLVARQVARELTVRDEDRGGKFPKVLISSACPTVVEYVKKYQGAFGSGVTDFHSPLMAHAEELKALYGNDIAVVFIGPCISKKRESDLHRDLVEAVIDFRDLEIWFGEKGILPEIISPADEAAFIPERAGKGALYPMDGGMIAAVKRYSIPPGVRYMAFSGIGEIDRALKELSETELDAPVFLELLACAGGCINGPRVRSRTGTIRKRLSVFSYAEDAPEIYTGPSPDISNTWYMKPIRETEPSAEEIAGALRRTGKYSREDELNCGGCGYDTCRDFARAMVSGKAEQEMCVSYMRKLAQKKANGLIRAIPSGVVIVDKDLRIVECNRNFVKLIGGDAEELWEAKPGLEGAELDKMVPFHRYFRDVLNGAPALDKDIKLDRRIFHATIFGIERGEFAGGVFQDVTAPWVRKDRVVSQARKVISKNLAVVQKIAFLLGENAAETEATLSSIIESFDDSGKADQESGDSRR